MKELCNKGTSFFCKEWYISNICFECVSYFARRKHTKEFKLNKSESSSIKLDVIIILLGTLKCDNVDVNDSILNVPLISDFTNMYWLVNKQIWGKTLITSEKKKNSHTESDECNYWFSTSNARLISIVNHKISFVMSCQRDSFHFFDLRCPKLGILLNCINDANLCYIQCILYRKK